MENLLPITSLKKVRDNANGKGAGNKTNKVLNIMGWFGKAMSH